jgi:hypothetical protein
MENAEIMQGWVGNIIASPHFYQQGTAKQCLKKAPRRRNQASKAGAKGQVRSYAEACRQAGQKLVSLE